MLARDAARGSIMGVSSNVKWRERLMKGTEVRPEAVVDSSTFTIDDVDWWLFEPVESAHKFLRAEGDNFARVPLTAKDFDTIAIPQGAQIGLGLPVGRFPHNGATLGCLLQGPVTVRAVLEAVYNCYTNTNFDVDKLIEGMCGDDFNGYKQRAHLRARAGHRVARYELNGGMTAMSWSSICTADEW